MPVLNVIPCSRLSRWTSDASSKFSGRRPTMTSRPAPADSTSRRIRSLSRKSPSEVRSTPSSRMPDMKFMAGDPMNPATNRLTGVS